jgi:hypothetical protein
MEFITGYTRIKDKSIIRDNEILFSGDELLLDDWMTTAYSSLKIDYPRFYKMDRLSKLGFLASELLLNDDAFKQYDGEAVAIILANKHASLDTDKRYYEVSKTVPSPALFVYTLPNIVIGEIAIRFGLKGENGFFVSESFEAETLKEYVFQVLSQPFVSACVAGWVDVMDEHHDVLVYLVEKQSRGLNLPHTAEQLNLLYRK